MKTITAIIQSYRRQENIPIIIKALNEQKLKPNRIIVWNDNDGSGRDLKESDLGDWIQIINTNSNEWHNCGAFLIAYFCTTDHIAIFDDDVLPSKDWLYFCMRNSKPKQILSGFGIKLRSNKYSNRLGYKSNLSPKKKFVEVDMAGQVYFFPKDAVLPMFTKRPPNWDHIVDLHFSFMARKAGYKIYVPYPELRTQLPFLSGLPIKATERAMYKRKGHLTKRNNYVKWAIENKIISRVV